MDTLLRKVGRSAAAHRVRAELVSNPAREKPITNPGEARKGLSTYMERVSHS